MESFERAMDLLFDYVDRQPPEKKDRVVRWDRWTTGVLEDTDGSKCIIGVVEGWGSRTHSASLASSDERRALVERINDAVRDGIATAFDNAVETYGMGRVVAALKKRAGASLDDLPQPEREAVGAG